MPVPTTAAAPGPEARRVRTRWLALLLTLVAAAVYVGFIALQLGRARGLT